MIPALFVQAVVLNALLSIYGRSWIVALLSTANIRKTNRKRRSLFKAFIRVVRILKTKSTVDRPQLNEGRTSQNVSHVALQVAHDIRSPLSVLALLSYDGFKFNQENRDLLVAASKRIQDITQTLAVAYSANTEQHRVYDMINSIICEKKSLMSSNEISISLTASPEIDNASIQTSYVELGRAISNLIDNSIEAFVDISFSKNIDIYLSTQNQMLEVSVCDNAQGIDPILLPHLAQRGFSTKAFGHGLGLHHAKAFCESSGGHFSIESRPDSGTNILLKLPLAQSQQPYYFSKNYDLFTTEAIS